MQMLIIYAVILYLHECVIYRALVSECVTVMADLLVPFTALVRMPLEMKELWLWPQQ